MPNDSAKPKDYPFSRIKVIAEKDTDAYKKAQKEKKEKEKIAREKALAAEKLAYKRYRDRLNPLYVDTPKEKHAKESGRGGFKHGGRVTRSIDGRAAKGLTRGSRRT